MDGTWTDNLDLATIKAHVIDRLDATELGTAPFYHMWINDIFPPDYYQALLANKRMRLHSGDFQERVQDSKEYVNRRFNLFNNDDPVIEIFRQVWSDADVKRAAYRRFYIKGVDELAERTEIHREFEYTFCVPNLFQNIHIDIPPKCLSFVFYLPDQDLDDQTELDNATILYDKSMKPEKAARFRDNSVCIFAPHFYSYHGFSSTMDRDALVMFLVEPDLFDVMRRPPKPGETKLDAFLDSVIVKMHQYTLTEYGTDPARWEAEKLACRVNSYSGRVLLDDDGNVAPVVEPLAKRRPLPQVTTTAAPAKSAAAKAPKPKQAAPKTPAAKVKKALPQPVKSALRSVRRLLNPK